MVQLNDASSTALQTSGQHAAPVAVVDDGGCAAQSSPWVNVEMETVSGVHTLVGECCVAPMQRGLRSLPRLHLLHTARLRSIVHSYGMQVHC
jgi:hypothetical protein